MVTAAVPRERFERWVLNFRGRHGETALGVTDGALAGSAADGVDLLGAAALRGGVRRAAGRSGVRARRSGPRPTGASCWCARAASRSRGWPATGSSGSKVGQRHVQGRTKAGGQSQQRFARRRDNQARQAYEAAADHAARILGRRAGTGSLVAGGDHVAVDEVLADPRLRHARVVGPWLAVPDPRRGVLEQAAVDAASAVIEVTNAQ